MKKKFQLEVPGGADKVLLHTCCAPCSSAIIECLMQHGVTPVIYYCNPNIYPLEEYIIRKDECTRYAQSLGLEIIDADYDHDAWRCRMAGMEQEPERGGRCLRCFKMRLQETARYAHEHGFPVITTTLASSRWKSLEQIEEAGRYATAPYPDVIVAVSSVCGKKKREDDGNEDVQTVDGCDVIGTLARCLRGARRHK